MLKKLLLVDDDPDECHLFREILAEINPEIVCYYASNGKDALEKLGNQDIMIPDLIFVDINMPIMDGWELLQYIKGHALYQKIPVIVYSVSSRNEDIERARVLGAGYFIKPSGIEELRDKLTALHEHSVSFSAFPGKSQ